MNNQLEQRQHTEPAAEPEEGSMMVPQGIENACKAIQEYFEAAKQLRRDLTIANAKQACENSRNAWLSMFPYRQVFVSRHRDLIGDFVQSLDDVTEQLADSTADVATKEDEEFYRHYLENMRGRARLLTSLLVGEENMKERLFQSTSELGAKRTK